MMIFFGAPILGQLSDRVGRKTILQVCVMGIVLAYVIISTAFALGSVLLLMIGRVLGWRYRRESSNFDGGFADRLLCKEQGLLAEHGAARIVGRLCDGSALSGLLANNRIVSWFTIHTPLHATVLLAGLDFVLLSLLFRQFRRPRSVRRTRLSLASGVFSLVSAFRSRGLREVSWVFLLQSLARGAYFFSSRISSWIPSM